MKSLYTKGKENFGSASIDLITGEIVVALIDLSFYTVDIDIDQYRSDIPSEAILKERTLQNTSFNDGIFDADDLTFPSLDSDLTVTAIVIYQDTGITSNSQLIFYTDEDSVGDPLNIVTDGDDFTIQWDNGLNKIFKL